MAEAEMAVAEMAAAVTAAEMAAAVTAEAATAAARKILLLVNICCSKMAVTAEAAAMAAAVKIKKVGVGWWVGGWVGLGLTRQQPAAAAKTKKSVTEAVGAPQVCSRAGRAGEGMEGSSPFKVEPMMPLQ